MNDKLLPNHQELIEKSAISAEVATARGYYSLPEGTPRMSLMGLGFSGKQAAHVPCLVIPIRNVQGKIALHQIRPDRPRTMKKNGIEKPLKYETPKGAAMVIDIHPFVREKLCDPSIPLWITEGSRKVDSAISHDLCCIGILGVWCWRGKNKYGGSTSLSDWEAIALEGRIVYVCFDSDVTQKPQVKKALSRLVNFLKSRKANVIVLKLPEGPSGEKVGLDDFLASGKTVEELLSHIAEEPSSTTEPETNLPKIDVSSGDLELQTKQVWEAIQLKNSPPTIFRYGNLPSRLEWDDLNRRRLRTIDSCRMRHLIARSAYFYKPGVEGAIRVYPPSAIVEDALATPNPPLPILTRIVYSPVFAPNGTLVTESGYNPSARIFMEARDLTIPPVPEKPTHEDIARARDLILNEVLGDFPFTSPADRANAVGMFILPFVRDLIDGPTPLHLIEKPSPGTGASLLVEILALIATGQPAHIMTEGGGEEEWRKRLTAVLLSSPSILLIDNLRKCLDSAALSAALTSETWADRILGHSRIELIPIRCTWIATGNNPAVSNEVSRRMVAIRMDTKMDRPWQRASEKFRHPDLRNWVRENRGRLIWAVLTIVRAWIAAGKPTEKSVTLGSFEAWAKNIGGILSVAGIPGFLDNLPEFYDRADEEGELWRVFIAAWWDRHGEKDVGVEELYELSTFNLGDGNEKSQKTRLGKKLRNSRDRQFDRWRIKSAGYDHRAAQYHLEPADGEPHEPGEPFNRVSGRGENELPKIADQSIDPAVAQNVHQVPHVHPFSESGTENTAGTEPQSAQNVRQVPHVHLPPTLNPGGCGLSDQEIAEMARQEEEPDALPF